MRGPVGRCLQTSRDPHLRRDQSHRRSPDRACRCPDLSCRRRTRGSCPGTRSDRCRGKLAISDLRSDRRIHQRRPRSCFDRNRVDRVRHPQRAGGSRFGRARGRETREHRYHACTGRRPAMPLQRHRPVGLRMTAGRWLPCLPELPPHRLRWCRMPRGRA